MDEELARLRKFPEITREELFRFFTNWYRASRPVRVHGEDEEEGCHGEIEPDNAGRDPLLMERLSRLPAVFRINSHQTMKLLKGTV